MVAALRIARGWGVLLAGAVCGIAVAGAMAGAMEPSPAAVQEHEAKAELIARIPSFVSWPDPSTEKRLRVTVVGRGAYQRALVETLDGREVGDRRFVVRIADRVSADDVPDVLVVDDPSAAAAKTAIAEIGDRPVLVIGNGRDATQHGCFVGIYLEDARLRFSAAPNAARDAGLVFRANFLKLARIAEPAPRGAPR